MWGTHKKGQRRIRDEHASSDETLLKALGAAVRVYYMSHEPQSACLDTSAKMSDCGLGEKQWSYQACTELVQPMEHKESEP